MSTSYRQTSKRAFLPLRRGGVADRTWMMLDPEERADIGRRTGVSERDLAAVERPGCSTTVRGRVFAALATPVLDAMIDALGAAADDPTPDELLAAAAEVCDRYTDAEIRFLFACVVEWRMPARGSIIELGSIDERYTIAPIGDGFTIPHRDGRCADPATRVERRARREQRSAEQARRRFQQASAREAGSGAPDPSGPDDAVVDRRAEHATRCDEAVEHLSTDIITPTRLVDRRLPAGVDGVKLPVGRIGGAYISWGPEGRYGKRRPVVIVGSTDEYLWVRPCYSRDHCAGGWRAAAIDDWTECGLDHTSYVDLELHRLPRNEVEIGPHRLTLRDWNRICRGEVRPD